MRNRTHRLLLFVLIGTVISVSQHLVFAQSVSLRWQQNPETDIEYYVIYRGTESNPTNEIARVFAGETSFEDVGIDVGAVYYYRVTAIDSASNVSPFSEEIVVSTGLITSIDQPTIPSESSLSQNYPNPFNPETEFDFSILDASEVTLTIYDLLGKEVKTLVTETKPAGHYKAVWDGSDNSSMKAASGIYFAKLVAGSFSQVRKIILQR